MFKSKVRAFFIFVKIINDIWVISASIVVGYILKFKLYIFGLNTKIYHHAQVENYLNVLGYVIILWLFAFILNGMYKNYTGPLGKMQEALAIVKGVLFGTFEIMAFTFLYKSFPDSRYVLAYATITAIILLIITRNIISSFMNWLHKKGIGNKRTIIIGNNKTAQRIAERIIVYPEFGFNYFGFIANKKPGEIIYPLRKKYRNLGSLKKLYDIIEKHKIKAIFCADNDFMQEDIYKLAKYCQQKNIYFRSTPTGYQLEHRYLSFDAIDTIPLMQIKPLEFAYFNRIIKRFFDLLAGVPLIIISAPLMLMITILIKTTSNGPAIYKQTRVTRNGKRFDFYKFRSMYLDSEKGPPVLATSDQKARSTRIGYFLRKTSLDELPQLFNVLKGEMSLVGPRPERPYFHDKYLKSIPHWDERLIVRGGITGWAQINGRAELTASPLEKLEYDLYYIENWSLLFDLKIILGTFGNVILQRNVY